MGKEGSRGGGSDLWVHLGSSGDDIGFKCSRGAEWFQQQLQLWPEG